MIKCRKRRKRDERAAANRSAGRSIKMRKSLGFILALTLALALLPAAAAEGAHAHIWRADWAIDDYHHWHGCADPACRTLVPNWAEGYGYHSYDNSRDPDCNVCGWVRAVDPGHVHTWGEGWSSDDTSHWRRCAEADCPGVVPTEAEDYAAHSYDNDQDPDCNVCGRNRFVGSDHPHTWLEDWSGDSGYHWRSCGDPDCPGVVPAEAKDYAAHSYDSDQDPDCNVCGRNRFVDPNHTHTWGEGWNGDGVCHWHRCTDVDCPGVAPSRAAGYGVHIYDGAQDVDCNICGKNRYVDPSHTHVWSADWNGDVTHHWHQCAGAGCPGVVPGWAEGYARHIYDGDQDPDCNVCGMSRVVLPPSSGELAMRPESDPDVTIVGRGRIGVKPVNPQAGVRTIVTLIPEEHYAVGTLTVTDTDGQPVETVSHSDGTWSFTHPGGRMKFRAVFLPCYEACARDSECPIAAYGDLATGQWYHDGIHYCLDWELMSGYDKTSFLPNEGLSGGMIAQILYNMAGRPELPQGSVYESADLWYDSAMAWAVGAGVMNADGDRLVSPGEEITREQLAVMLWRCAGRPTALGQALRFYDAGSVSPWAAEAVRWVVEQGILQGRADGLLDPGGRLTRAEAAAMLVRFHSRELFVWKEQP